MANFKIGLQYLPAGIEEIHKIPHCLGLTGIIH
jgi:hypothetical protein